jgi:hypothetical protein
MEDLAKKISQLPQEMQKEINDFIDFLMQKQSLNESSLNQEFPQPLGDEEELGEKFSGQNIAICDDQIIAADKSLKKLHEKIKEIMLTEKSCLIRYIDAGVPFYEFNLQN